jgi:hypothetical protein
MILFELYNEPILNQGNSNQAQGDPWECWQNGCTTANGWQAAGMQQMIDAVRGVGATQVLIINGIEWSNKIDGWLAHKPTDPMNNLAAGFHLYNDVACANSGCWNGALAGVAAQVPVITGEFGDKSNGTGFASSYMSWADSKGISYIAWSWFVGTPSTPPLLSAYDGAPSTWGATVKSHYLQVNP